MPCAANVVTLSCLAAIAQALVISHQVNSDPYLSHHLPTQPPKQLPPPAQKPARHRPSVQPPMRHQVPTERPTTTDIPSVADIPSIVKEQAENIEDNGSPSPVTSSPVTPYYTCSGSTCSVNMTKMTAELQPGLILFLGCSLDVYAINHFCTAAETGIVGFTNNFAYLAHCKVGGVTLVYAFQPGASPPPYWKHYTGAATSQQIISQSAKDVAATFGEKPMAIVVDSSLWDVSNWWQKDGMPPEPYPVPHAEIAQWCQTDVPQLLHWVDTAFPGTKIAFRTPPPVFPNNDYGQSPQTVDEMVGCLRANATDHTTQKVFSQYHLLDFNELVEQFVSHQAVPTLQFYEDVLHPGRQLSMVYMNAVLEWVHGLQHDPSR